MVFYPRLKLSSSHIGAAVAKAIIHDIQVNSLGLEGFPQVAVGHLVNGEFIISLKYDNTVQMFSLTETEASNAVELMRKQNYCRDIFPKVQNALAELEGMNRHSRRSG